MTFSFQFPRAWLWCHATLLKPGCSAFSGFSETWPWGWHHCFLIVKGICVIHSSLLMVTSVLFLKSGEPNSNGQLAMWVCPFTAEGRMDTIGQNGKGMVFWADWAELQCRMCPVWAVRRWASYLPAYETHPFYLEMPPGQECYETREWFL